MTIDDDNSIYVGGLPYDCTEDSIRRVFNLYGAVVAIKIINDREIGGKCYGFVTFTNPRSAIDAINDMNGRTIGGRVVRVNEVKTRGGRSHLNRENSHRDSERDMDMDWDRARERERDHDHDRDRYRDRIHNRSRDRDIERETEYEHPRDHDRSRGRFSVRDRVQDHVHNEQERNINHDRDQGRELDLDSNRDREVDRSNDNERKDKDNDQLSKSRIGSHFVDGRSRELSSNSSDDYDDEVKEQLEISIQRHGELQKEISQIEEKFEEKNQLVSELKKKSQKLEDALTSAKKLTSQRQHQLTMLQRCFLQVTDYTEKLKNSEQELQSLVDTAMVDADDGDDAANGDGALHTYGKA
ncbi:RNA recognition motif domain [Macleaya cordata]|uniref:RNA recognition motif domain n=1 Tax=Macleaya cordata TaxID=56857 RepID=A0A200Q836_MACCD|nr:RNA recognition motif domain [Macleaya cordata]